MNRRDFLRRASFAASGIVAADQFELLDRMGWVRRFFASFCMRREERPWQGYPPITNSQWDKLLQENYVKDSLSFAIEFAKPFESALVSTHRMVEGSERIYAAAPVLWTPPERLAVNVPAIEESRAKSLRDLIPRENISTSTIPEWKPYNELPPAIPSASSLRAMRDRLLDS